MFIKELNYGFRSFQPHPWLSGRTAPDSDIVNDFGADSLDVIDMITTLSDEFGVEIPDEDIENFHTVGDVVNYLEERI